MKKMLKMLWKFIAIVLLSLYSYSATGFGEMSVVEAFSGPTGMFLVGVGLISLTVIIRSRFAK